MPESIYTLLGNYIDITTGILAVCTFIFIIITAFSWKIHKG